LIISRLSSHQADLNQITMKFYRKSQIHATKSYIKEIKICTN